MTREELISLKAGDWVACSDGTIGKIIAWACVGTSQQFAQSQRGAAATQHVILSPQFDYYHHDRILYQIDPEAIIMTLACQLKEQRNMWPHRSSRR